jgi:predicted DNA binding CopG/RHH family protein
MKVTGETLSSYKKRKGAEGEKYQKYLNSQAKELLPDRTLESFILKGTEIVIT